MRDRPSRFLGARPLPVVQDRHGQREEQRGRQHQRRPLRRVRASRTPSWLERSRNVPVVPRPTRVSSSVTPTGTTSASRRRRNTAGVDRMASAKSRYPAVSRIASTRPGAAVKIHVP
ncbi:hypothetical protein NKG94_37985 [Micromonospora sp. M12]